MKRLTKDGDFLSMKDSTWEDAVKIAEKIGLGWKFAPKKDWKAWKGVKPKAEEVVEVVNEAQKGKGGKKDKKDDKKDKKQPQPKKDNPKKKK